MRLFRRKIRQLIKYGYNLTYIPFRPKFGDHQKSKGIIFKKNMCIFLKYGNHNETLVF